jgi:hypothetical protein
VIQGAPRALEKKQAELLEEEVEVAVELVQKQLVDQSEIATQHSLPIYGRLSQEPKE